MRKKSLSPIISTVLLVVVAVILVTLILTWGKDFTNSKLSPPTISFLKSEISSFLFVRSVHQLETENIIFIKNAHEKEAINFIGYKLHTDTGYVFENQLLYFDEVKELSPGEIKPLNVICFPEKSFTIELVTDKNTFVNFSINIPNFNETSYCMGKQGVVVAYDMITIINEQLIDISGNGFNGLINQGFIQTTNGLKTLENNKIKISNNAIITTTPYTIIGTFNHQYGTGDQVIFSNSISSNNKIIDSIGIKDKKIALNFLSNGSSNFESVLSFEDNVVTTFTFIFDDNQGNDFKIYVNSIESEINISNFYRSGDNSHLFNRATNNVGFFGEILDFRIYNRALTDQEIKDYHSIMTNPLD